MKERQPSIFVFEEQRLAGTFRVLVAETEYAVIRTLARREVLKVESPDFPFTDFNFYLGEFARLFDDVEPHQVFTPGVELEVEEIAQLAIIDLHYAIADFDPKFISEREGVDRGNYHALFFPGRVDGIDSLE
jgi:hypothetical protein